MTSDGARRIAEAYLSTRPAPQEDYLWVVGEPNRVRDGWYFDFELR